MNKKPEALIDLDGTIADYVGSMLAKLESLRSPAEEQILDIENVPTWIESRMTLIKNVPGFWRGLQPIEEGFMVVKLMRLAGYNLNVLTKGPKKTSIAWSEKFEWCQEYIPDADITITQQKALTYGKVLFDDYPKYVEPWLQHRPRGLVIMLEHSWNKNFSHPNVIKLKRLTEKGFTENLAFISQRLFELAGKS